VAGGLMIRFIHIILQPWYLELSPGISQKGKINLLGKNGKMTT
jgi:hypothetical protein